MKVSVIGTGYVGLVTGVCLAEFGNDVICMDLDEGKIDRLRAGEVPIYEPGLDTLIESGVNKGKLRFTSDYAEAMEGCEAAFIAVGTPTGAEGAAELKYVLSAAGSIAAHMNRYTVIVDKSTVPVGTGDLVAKTIADGLKARGADIPFDVVSNPEFLREGTAVKDFLDPDRVVIGVDADRARGVMLEVYKALREKEFPIILCEVKTAELIKYASNAYLATRLTFINELSVLCEAIGSDVTTVSLAMGKDARIGHRYLNAGAGYGGSCFPKDTRALQHTAKEYGVGLTIVGAVIEANDKQKLHMVEKITKAMGDVAGQRIAVLGIAFKPETDDIREAPALIIIRELAARGAVIAAYDPIAMDNAKAALAGVSLTYVDSAEEAVRGADAAVLVTEWDCFRKMDMAGVKSLMRGDILFDLRNIYDPKEMAALGFRYCGVGR
jgi:UDPglucose 6-dehydrogenase